MAHIIPFKGIRPPLDKVHMVASRSYASYSKEELRQKMEMNPYTFLHVLRPEDPPPYSDTHKLNEYQKKIKLKFEEFIENDILIQDQKKCYYVYRQIKEDFVHTGIIGCISIEDYFNGTIKKHEETLSNREELLKQYLKTVDINAEPVCFAYPDHQSLNKQIDDITNTAPTYDFTTTNKSRHQLWVVEDANEIAHIGQSFEEISSIYIADGHHRSASSCLLGREKRTEENNNGITSKSDFFMGLFIPESQLQILNFNRVVEGLNHLSEDQFLSLLDQHFSVSKIGHEAHAPTQLHQFSMYLNNNWYTLELKKETYTSNNPVDYLDPSILSDLILTPILGIQDIRTDKRIKFIGGKEGMEKLKTLVDSGKMTVAFGLYPVTIEQLKEVSDKGQVMPPKSTWIEPKLRSGLTIYSLSK